MTTTTAARRPLVGWLIAIAGLAALLAVVLVLIAPSVHLTWLGLVADIALTLAFLFMAIGKGAKVIVRVAYAVGAVGWAILAIGSLVTLGTVLQIGIVLALVGTLVAGIAGMLRHVYSRAANLWFLLASIVVAVVLFNQLHGFLTGTFGVIVSALYGLLLLIAGVLIALRR